MLHVNDFQAINGRFSNKAYLQCKEALFALKRSLLLRTKKPCLKTGGISLLSTCNPYTVPVLYVTMITSKRLRDAALYTFVYHYTFAAKSKSLII